MLGIRWGGEILIVDVYFCFTQFKCVARDGQAPFDVVFPLVYRPVDWVCRMVEHHHIVIADAS